MPRLRLHAALGAATFAFAIATAGAAFAQTPASLRYTTGAPPKTPWVAHLDRFADDIAEIGKGSLVIEKFIAAQLGNEQDTIQQVARGRIDMGGFSVVAASLLLPEVGLTQLPFYFKNPAEQDCVLDNHLKAVVTERLAKKGLRFLSWTAVGAADIIGKKAYMVPEDVRGLKAGAAAMKVSAMMWTALGANPNPLGITEIAAAFQTGLVDLQSQVVSFYVPSGLSKIAPVMTRVELSEAPGLVVINQAAYDKLTPEQRGVLDQAIAKRTEASMRQDIRGFEQVLRDIHVKAGGQVVAITPEQRDLWRKVLEPTWPLMVKELGADGESFFALIQKGKAACAK